MCNPTLNEEMEMADTPNTGNMLNEALRNRSAIWERLRTAQEWPMGKAALVNIGLSAFYGLVMGAYGIPGSVGWKQALASTIKVPCLFLLTLVVCLPTLYVVSALLGSNLSLRQLVGILLASFLVTTVLLASFAPITLFFMLSARNYFFIKLLNVLFFAIATGTGAAVIAAAVRNIAAKDVAGYRTLLRFWFVIYAFVGTQMAWMLRPFVGSPNEGFQLFRDFQGNFYTDVIHSLSRLLG
jgi:hypothetical protein